MSLPLTFFIDPLVLLKGNSSENVLKARRSMPTKHRTSSLSIIAIKEDQRSKSFTFPVVFLISWDLLLTVLVYMQEQQNCSNKTSHICFEIASNCSSRISFKCTHRKKAPSNKTLALEKSMNMDIWVVGTSIKSTL